MVETDKEKRATKASKAFALPYGTVESCDKKTIMSFLDWVETYKDATLFHYDGVKESEPFLNSFEWEELVDEFLWKDKE